MPAIAPWMWFVVGLVLVGAETIAPGVFLLWLGIAAILTGALAGVLDLSPQAALVAFALLALASVALGRALTRSRGGPDQLNRRGRDLVGRSFPLDGPLVGGEGRIRLGDSVWRVVGPDAPAGASVRVVRLDGATLVVEPG